MKEIDDAFAHIKSMCAELQYESLDKFKNAFIEYLWARCDFESSVFIFQRSEWSMSQFLDWRPSTTQH